MRLGIHNKSHREYFTDPCLLEQHSWTGQSQQVIHSSDKGSFPAVGMLIKLTLCNDCRWVFLKQQNLNYHKRDKFITIPVTPEAALWLPGWNPSTDHLTPNLPPASCRVPTSQNTSFSPSSSPEWQAGPSTSVTQNYLHALGFPQIQVLLPCPEDWTLLASPSAKSLRAGMVTPKVWYGYTNVLQNKPLTRWAVEKQYNRSPRLCSSPLSMAKVQGSKSVQDTEPPTQTNTAAAQPSSSNCTTESEHIPRKHLSVESYKPRHIKDDLFGVGQYEN